MVFGVKLINWKIVVEEEKNSDFPVRTDIRPGGRFLNFELIVDCQIFEVFLI